MTDYEKLTLEIWTNGTISPERALSLAATLLNEHLETFVTSEEGLRADSLGLVADSELETVLAKSLDEFDLSVRTANCLKNASIGTVRELVSRTENEILEMKNFGKKSLEELQELLGRLGLSFGMSVSDQPGAGYGA